MSKLIITLSTSGIVLFLTLGCLSCYAQQVNEKSIASTVTKKRTDTPKEERVSDIDIVIPSNEFPSELNFASPQEYARAKQAWIDAHPEEDEIMRVQASRGSESHASTLHGEEHIAAMKTRTKTSKEEGITNNNGMSPSNEFPSELNFASPQEYARAKQAWIDTHPEEDEIMRVQASRGSESHGPTLNGEEHIAAMKTRTKTSKEEGITNNNRMSPSNEFPSELNFASPQEYARAKQAWIDAHPEEDEMMRGERP